MDKIPRIRLSREEYNQIIKLRENSEKRVLIIGDLHAPFIKYGYLEFAKEMESKYGTNITVFIGDIIDNHASSFHDSDPDGHGAGAELLRAKKEISYWYRAFPVAKVCYGNHCRIPYRKAFNAGISNSWIKTIDEVVETPNWEYSESFIIDDVLYTHGLGRQAHKRAQNDIISVVQGHYHSKSRIDFFVGESFKIWSMQIGCGIDRNSYAMAYAKHFDKPHINVGIVLDNGKLPIIEMMKL